MESNAFELLLFGYAVNHGSVSVIDLTVGEEIPQEILSALSTTRISPNGHSTQTLSASVQLAIETSPGTVYRLQHPGGSGRRLPRFFLMEMFHDMVHIFRTAPFPGRSWKCQSRIAL